MDAIFFWLAARLGLAFALAALAAVLGRASLGPVPESAARLGALALVLLVLTATALFLAPLGQGRTFAPLFGVGVLCLGGALYLRRRGPVAVVPARLRAPLAVALVLVPASALLGELATLATVLPLAALLLALLDRPLSVLLPVAAIVGGLAGAAALAPTNVGMALLPWLGVGLLACLPRPRRAATGLG